MDAEHDHPGKDLVKNIGEFQVFIPAVNIIQAVADLDLWGKNKTGEIEIEA